MKINNKPKNDYYFFTLFKEGIFTVSKDGVLYNNIINKHYIYHGKKHKYQRVSYQGKGIQAHRLVWMIFNNTLIPTGFEINHIDGIKSNNFPNNLELVTASQNVKHAFLTGLNSVSEFNKLMHSDRASGEKNINAKLKDDEVIQLRKDFNNKIITKKEIEEKYNLCRRAVENILLGKSYRHLPFETKILSKNNKTENKNKGNLIRNLYKTGTHTQKSLAIKFNLSRSSIKDILNYKMYK